MYESVGVEAPILLSYTHKNEWNTHVGLPTRCQRSAMGVSLIFVGARQQNGCFDTHTFIQFSTYVCYMLVFWYFVLENTAPPVVEPPENGGFVLMKHYIPKVGFMKNYLRLVVNFVVNENN